MASPGVPGDLNPADELSCGLMPAELCQDHRWFTGPPFLSLPPGNWPSSGNAKDLAATPEELVECLAVCEAGEPHDVSFVSFVLPPGFYALLGTFALEFDRGGLSKRRILRQRSGNTRRPLGQATIRNRAGSST